MSRQLDSAEKLLAIQNALGKSLWQIQAFENTLALLIALVLKKIPPRASIEEAEAILDKTRTKKLVDLIKKTRESDLLDDSIEKFLNKLREERNWLVHRSWNTHSEFLNHEQEFIDLRYRISRLAADAQEFNVFFASIIESWGRKRGVTEAEIKALSKELTDVWRQS